MTETVTPRVQTRYGEITTVMVQQIGAVNDQPVPAAQLVGQHGKMRAIVGWPHSYVFVGQVTSVTSTGVVFAADRFQQTAENGDVEWVHQPRTFEFRLDEIFYFVPRD